MTGIDRLSGATPITGTQGGANDARSLAGKAIGEIGQRVLAWVGASGGSSAGAASLASSTGVQSDFRPDTTTLARGGDVYDLNGLAGHVAGQLGATPTQEGDLRRSLQDFTRAAVVQLAGLSGASGDNQVAGVRDAFGAAVDGPGTNDIDGVIARVDRGTDTLTRANGG